MPLELTTTLPAPGEALSATGDRGDLVRVETSSGNWRATLTFGASSVTLSGPERSFTETTTSDAVRHSVWVRILPRPFTGNLNSAWLRNALHANQRGTPDVLAVAMQYLHDASDIFDGELQIAGSASYGPLVDGRRQEGSDFSDYLGITWSYSDGLIDQPEPGQVRCLDCSGYVRMVFGYRSSLTGLGRASIPLCHSPQLNRSALPRRAHEMYEFGPGVIVIENAQVQVQDFGSIVPGDLVFFDADESDGDRLDHVGIYLGLDEGGHHRFISSRKTHNGPTLGDTNGRSVLDGNGHYASAFRSALRP